MSIQILASKSIKLIKSLSINRNCIRLNGTILVFDNFSEREDINNLFNKKIKNKKSNLIINFYCLENYKEQSKNEYGWIPIDSEFDYNKITGNFYLEGSCSLNYADWHELKKDIMLKNEGFLSFNIAYIDAEKFIEDTNSIQAKLQLSLTDYEINYTYNNENCE